MKRSAQLFAGLMAVAWLCPDHFLPWTAFISDAIAGLALVTAWMLAIGASRTPVPFSRPCLFVGALAAIPLVQFAAGQIFFFGDAFLAALYLLGLAGAIQLGGLWQARSAVSAKPMRWLAWSLVLTGLVSTAIAVLQWLSLPPPFGQIALPGRDHRAFANFAQPNQFATFQMLGCLMAAWLWERKLLVARWLLVVVAFLAVGAALSRSRTVLAEVVVVLAWLLRPGRPEGSSPARWPLIACGLLFGALFFSIDPIERLLELAPSRSVAEQSGAGARPIHWATALDAIARSPWTGYGWNQAAVGIGRVAAQHAPSGWFIEHAHDILLDLLLWNGIPLGLVVIAAAAAWMYRAARAPVGTGSVWLFGVLLVLTTHALLEFPLEYAYLLFPAGVVVGHLEARAMPASAWRAPQGLALVLPLLGLLTTGAVAVDYLRLEQDLRQLRFQAARIGDPVPLDPPEALILTQLRSFVRFAETPATRRMSASGLDEMRRVAERYGYAPVLFRFAIASALNGRADEAVGSLIRLCKQQSAARCDEAREHWQAMRADASWPELRGIPFPEVEPRR